MSNQLFVSSKSAKYATINLKLLLLSTVFRIYLFNIYLQNKAKEKNKFKVRTVKKA